MVIQLHSDGTRLLNEAGEEIGTISKAVDIHIMLTAPAPGASDPKPPPYPQPGTVGWDKNPPSYVEPAPGASETHVPCKHCTFEGTDEEWEARHD